jgi:hypothetical protein
MIKFPEIAAKVKALNTDGKVRVVLLRSENNKPIVIQMVEFYGGSYSVTPAGNLRKFVREALQADIKQAETFRVEAIPECLRADIEDGMFERQ